MQAEFYVELEEGADRLEIPWSSPNEPSNRYYDLRASPELLEDIVEARLNSSLRQFLAKVNGPDTLMATVKCDTWHTSELSAAERASFPAARLKFASYVDLVFSQPLLNFHREHYEQLARRLIQQLNSVAVPARAELCLRRCYYRAREAWGFYLTVFLYAYGSDAVEAERHWATALGAFGVALARLSAVLRQALQQVEAP